MLRLLLSPAQRRLHQLQQRARAATGDQVVAGPFKGQRYAPRAVGSLLACKLLGTYEKELTPVIEQAVATAYPKIIDIGAAEGYYAVGLARRIPSTRVIAFEAETRHHEILLDMARVNGVQDQIQLEGFCSAASLNTAFAGGQRTLVICDVEGFEDELLNPTTVPALQHADLLVELHDFARPGIGQKLRDRFAATHSITQITTVPRQLSDWPGLPGFTDDEKLRAMHEGRPGDMDWLWMQARHVS